MKDLIIAIDGYSSTGKSTLAKLLAKRLGYIHIDSGAMYRAITLYAIQADMFTDEEPDKERLVSKLESIDIHFELNPETSENEIYLNGKNAEKEIRGMEVSSKVSLIAKIAEVRDYAVDLQRKMSRKKRVVMDGRDIGTTVFPHADLKIFLNASAEIRAQRRFKELQSKENAPTLEEVIANIEERDRLDTTREISPLRKAEDAVEIDNGNLLPKETVDRILELIEDKFS